VSDPLVIPARLSIPVIADAWTDPQIMLISNGLVNTPAIDDTSRNEQIVASALIYDVEIQNNTFGVTF